MGVLILPYIYILMGMFVALSSGAALIQQNGTQFSLITEKAKEQRDNATGVVTVVFADRKYLPVAINWFFHYRAVMEDVNASGALLITYNDEDACNKAQTLGIPCAYSTDYTLPLRQNTDYFYFRVLVLDTLIRAGLKVLQSDADAIWLRNPLPYISSGVGIIASRGNWPRELYRKWHFTACMGFIYFDGAHFNATFFFKHWNNCTGDDQICFNYIIYKHFTPRVTANATDDTRVQLVPKAHNPHLKEFDLILLPDALFVRNCSATHGASSLLSTQKTAVVMHCQAKQESKAKLHWINVAGLWWYNVSKNHTQ